MTRQEIVDLIILLITDNTNREITAQRLRTVLAALNDSAFNLQDDSSGFVTIDQLPAGILPSGGTTGQTLSKLSDTSFDVGWVDKLTDIVNTWALLQTFSSIVSKQVYTDKQTFSLVGASPSQAINLDNGSLISVDLTGASGTATLTFSNPKVGASYWIQVTQAATAVNLSIANSGRFDGETGATVTGANSVNLAIFLLYDGAGYFFNKSEVS